MEDHYTGSLSVHPGLGERNTILSLILKAKDVCGEIGVEIKKQLHQQSGRNLAVISDVLPQWCKKVQVGDVIISLKGY